MDLRFTKKTQHKAGIKSEIKRKMCEGVPKTPRAFGIARRYILRRQTISLVSQRLDVTDNHGVRNSAVVRKQLERSGRVLAVFQGHSHKNDLRDIGGIHSCTHVAMVEGSGPGNNAYSTVTVRGDGTLELHGFRQQRSYHWPKS